MAYYEKVDPLEKFFNAKICLKCKSTQNPKRIICYKKHCGGVLRKRRIKTK